MKALNPCEVRVLNLLMEGASDREIACQVHMKLRTVKDINRRLFLRYGIHDGTKRVKLATRCYRLILEGIELDRKLSEYESGRLSMVWPAD